MTYLGMDTSRESLYVMANGKEFFSLVNNDCNMKHSVYLMDMIETALEKAGVSVKDIDVFACVNGPGSFTGIRIGVSTVKAFSFALGKPVLSITSFETILYGMDEMNGKCLVLIDAGHDNFYYCGYDENGNLDIPHSFGSRSQIEEKYGGRIVVSDKQIDGMDCIVADIMKGFKTAVEKNLSRSSMDREQLVPLYIRKSQAEENR